MELKYLKLARSNRQRNLLDRDLKPNNIELKQLTVRLYSLLSTLYSLLSLLFSPLSSLLSPLSSLLSPLSSLLSTHHHSSHSVLLIKFPENLAVPTLEAFDARRKGNHLEIQILSIQQQKGRTRTWKVRVREVLIVIHHSGPHQVSEMH